MSVAVCFSAVGEMWVTSIHEAYSKTDYDRHFEELLERVETLLIGILRMRLNKETLDQVAHYHSLLENVRRLSAGDGKTMETTMSTETKLFLRKTEELSTLVTAMKTLQAPCELELLEIEEKLTDLSIAMEKDKCLNAGGKFEWVDSVLVKCLQNGTWLLLDQVNLCSPAILDRLNGLLEPNGALTIGEKGVDQGGNVFTVKAHKNFRLFLAMDPRHGEISRAMRNRGVEISIPTPHHVLPCNPLDVASLLNSCGIRSVDHQKLIEKIHESLYDKQYKLNEMLQVASFTSQQMLKGFTFERSLRNSYRELCGTFDWRSRKEASRKIEEILSEYAENEGGAEVLYDLNAITLRMCDLRRNARLAVIRQQGFLLKYAVEKLRSKFYSHLLLDFYERSSLDDLQIRRMWSCDTFSKNKLNELAEINEYLSGEVENLEFLFRNKSALEVPLSLLEPTTLSNNLTIAMYFRLMTLECQSEKNLQKKKDIIDLKEYSSAVCSGRLSTNLKNEPLILKFAELIEQSGKIIDIVLHDEHLSINDKEYVELRDSLKSYIRFHDLGTIELVDKSQGTFFDLREIISSLEVHYKWLVKFFKKLFALFDGKLCDRKTQQEFTNFSSKYLNLLTDVDKFRKIRKKIKKLLLVPSPHFSEDSMNFHEKLRSTLRKFEINEEDAIDVAKTRSKVVSIVENSTVREKLIEICVKKFKDTGEGSNSAQDLVEIDELAGKIADVTEIRENSGKMSEDSREVEMWPIYEFFFLLFTYRFQGKFCEEFSNIEEISQKFHRDSSNEISDTLMICDESNEKTGETFGKIYDERVLKKFEEVPTIPAHLISLMKALNSDETMPKQRISLFLELLFFIEEFTERSFAVKNSNVLLHWHDRTETEEGEKDATNILETSFMNKSTLCNLIFELFLTKSGNRREIINFGNYKYQKRLLKSIQTLLWKNSLILNSNEFNISKNDSILLQFYMNYYLSAIKKVINANEEQKDLKDRFIEPMKLLQKIQEKMKNENSVVERGNGWLILGYLQIFLFHDLGSIDPVQKIALKSKYIRENISELEYLICVENLQSVILATCLSKDRKLSRVNHLNESSNEAKNFENFHAARPTSSFQNLREEIGNFAGNIGSFDTIFKQMNHLNDVAEQLQRKESLASHREKLHEAMIWKRSLERFSGKLEKNFLVGFPDLVSPMIAAISNLHRGVSILIHELSNMQFQSSNSDVCYNLLRFPAVGLCQESYINLVKLCSSEKLVFILAKQSISKSVQKDRFTMSKIALKELENLSLVARDRLKSLWEELNKIFMKIRILWKEQEKQREEEMKEKQSLFKTKIGTKEEEESDFRKMFPGFQQDFLELAEMFPGSQQDFQELQRIPESVSDEKESFVELISTKDARKIQEIHWNILRNSSFSEKNSKTSLIRRSKSSLKASEANSEPDFIEPLIERFQLLGPSVNTWSENLSSQLVCSLNVLISQKCSFDDRKGDKEVYDFYRDPNIPEIEECQPCFDKFCARINELLKEWPENPILNSIKLIVDRLFSFSVDSSLSRFLVGVELLLTKIQQWEENAHLGVSLAEFIQFFGEKILRWRKLEISRWKDSLEVLEDDLKTEASKWWFFLFNLIDQYLIDDIEQSLVEQSDILEDVKQSEVSKEKMIESLERFLTESTLIEFEARLQLIYLFYQHIGYLKESKKQKELSAILWNVYFYYNQFLGDVQNKIKVLKEPVAKKLKDTIKITRWNDISYWSVKNTAEKTRRTLHKFVKEFQKGLKENVASCLTLKTKAETLEMSSRRELNSSDFVINTQSGKLKKIQKLTHKARLFCENIIVRSNYPQIRKDIETFIEESLEESKRLKNLEVDKTLTKAKQQSQLKSMLQQKKMALANYFKTLSRLGISYRIGILTWKNRKNQITNFTCTPLDLQEIQRFEFKGFENKNVEKGLIEQWSDCNRYYYESLVKFNFLDGILNSGKSDLGIQNAERCRGLSVHLVLLAHRQKETIANFFKHFLPFRIQVSNLIVMRQDAIKKVSHASDMDTTTSEVVEPENINIPRQKNLQIVMKNFQALLEVLQISVRQSIIFLESCPMESLAEENLLDLNEAAVAVLKENSVSTDLITSMKDSLNLIKYMASELNTWITISKRVEESGQVFLLHQRHIDFLQASYQKISEIKRRLIDFRCTFTLDHPITENLNFLVEKLDESSELFKSTFNSPIEELDKSNNLKLIQQKSIEGTDDPEKESTDDVDFQENLITEGLIESLKKDVPDLRLKTISQIFGELMKIIEDSDVKSANDYTRSLLQHVPLLEQYVLFLHYYLHEQVASFRLTCKFLYLQLNVFLDLAIHGFCQPDNMDAPKDDQESGIKEGGMGLAEGEGQKDISDQIESEDQLEETRGPNEEEKDKEKKDTKEEEKGIEMSENFEGHLQELEPREEEEENNEEDDELDKEMGETDETAEKLDEEIWKDEEEEEEEENQDEENKKEEKGTGEKTGQEELSAKDDTDKNKDKDEDEESGEKKEEEEKKEINELDEPEANDDQIDPYHGKHQPEPEPEAFDLPEDINLDEEMKEDNPEGEEENPFDIDEMKEPRIPEEKENEESEEKEGPEEDKEQDSDDNDDEGAEAEEEDPNAESNKRKDEKVKDPDEDKKDEADEQNLEEENQPEEEKAPASSDAGSKEVDAAQEPESRKDGSRDAVASQSSEEQMEINRTESSVDDRKDKGTGQSQTEEREGHSGSKQEENAPTTGEEITSKAVPKRRKPGESNEDRSLLDDDTQPSAKKLKTALTQKNIDRCEERETNEGGGESTTYEHIKNTEKFDDYVFDAATEEQVKKQASNLEEDKMDDKLEDEDTKMHEDPIEEDKEEEAKKEQSQKLPESKKEKSTNVRGQRSDDIEQMEVEGEVEGETVETTRVLRGNESSIHTKLPETESYDISTNDIAQRRSEIENMLSQLSQGSSSVEAANAWSSISALTESAARELSEKLRLVLEPTLTSRLKGDYRTGRRINMRKVIPYIASEFRKDKIWLRRTKPSKRDYQIVLAIDDSSSMADNHSKELAFESLSLIGKAMTYLEIGQLAVVNFGERVNILHPFGENFTDESGARLIQEMKFEQKKTMIGQLLDFMIEMFSSQSSSSDNAKLVTILSDGRGIFSEGVENVNAAVRRAKLLNIFLVFIVVDNPLSKDSILDIRMPVFENGKLLGIRSYMDNFPFPFYIILRDLDTLPVVLSDALRQWFEIVGRSDT
ncbi:PREDICTED: LOW QUALITY PROTEIN: midasin-like [Habropoda laboriosa]|uniref:LOW QUALITY PROTEIN: midasin-like n=1 Tax=Habropoda laboriosa TaxID=597456 RepID=UPI00083D0496|nr:PREDICTED: LOW QUALITY PROTEIN: midasin-like [Habropoda laboriosa]